MRYRLRELSFEVPEGLDDQSMVVLVDGERAALTVARDTLAGPLADYVDAMVGELQGTLASYRLEERAARGVGGRPALVLHHTALSDEGRAVRQRQACVDLGGAVLIVTVTGPADASEPAGALFEKVLATLALG